jgi:nicotinamide-nucleotide amidase
MSLPIETYQQSLRARAQDIVSALKAAKMTIVTAESCTAGSIATRLSQADGASDVLHGGFVTYTKAQKISALGVSERLLHDDGAVNAEVVKEMATGALERSPAAMALAVSGVLGPEEDEDGNPVGLVWYCVAIRGRAPEAVRSDFGKQPSDTLRELVINRALDLIAEAHQRFAPANSRSR